MSDWPNEDLSEDLIPLTDLDEDEQVYSLAEVADLREIMTESSRLLPEEITRLLSPLDERERVILVLRFGLDRGETRTLEEVGELLNLTRERIGQIEARAMSKLRHPNLDTGENDLKSV